MDLKRTALFDEHRAAGARIVPFAGWEMPVQYAGVIEEVRAVREDCGIFDVSHMAQFDLTAGSDGLSVAEPLNRLVSADWSKTAVGRVAYALLLNEEGGVIDDIMGYRVGDNEWLIVANASRAEVDEPHIVKHLSPLRFENRYSYQAMLALQGPRAAEILQPFCEGIDLAGMQWRDCALARIDGALGLLARGGYTGSDGFEFMFRAEAAPNIWRKLTEASAIPCGLGARDVLRLEAGLPLYGHELCEDWTPYESSCGWAVKMDKPEFIGREALLDKKSPGRRIQALRMQGKAIPREHYAVQQNGETIGEITSGTLSPTIGGGIALAMLPTSLQIGDDVDVVIRGSAHAATVTARPFVAHSKK